LIEACFVAFVLSADDGDPLGDASKDADGRRIEAFEPGMVEYLPAGRDVKFGQPAASAGYAEYMRVQLHAVAAAVGLTYELLTADLSQVNYSSIRAGLLEFRRRIEQLQWQVFIPALCRPSPQAAKRQDIQRLGAGLLQSLRPPVPCRTSISAPNGHRPALRRSIP